jgi:hypothetical protein
MNGGEEVSDCFFFQLVGISLGRSRGSFESLFNSNIITHEHPNTIFLRLQKVQMIDERKAKLYTDLKSSSYLNSKLQTPNSKLQTPNSKLPNRLVRHSKSFLVPAA